MNRLECEVKHVHKDKVEIVKKNMVNEEVMYDLSELFKVFGDSTRIRILSSLVEGELCVCDIAELLNMTHSAISHQLRILKQAQLVKYKKKGKEVYYSLKDNHVITIMQQGLEHILE